MGFKYIRYLGEHNTELMMMGALREGKNWVSIGPPERERNLIFCF